MEGVSRRTRRLIAPWTEQTLIAVEVQRKNRDGGSRNKSLTEGVELGLDS